MNPFTVSEKTPRKGRFLALSGSVLLAPCMTALDNVLARNFGNFTDDRQICISWLFDEFPVSSPFVDLRQLKPLATLFATLGHHEAPPVILALSFGRKTPDISRFVRPRAIAAVRADRCGNNLEAYGVFISHEQFPFRAYTACIGRNADFLNFNGLVSANSLLCAFSTNNAKCR